MELILLLTFSDELMKFFDINSIEISKPQCNINNDSSKK
jgi:hypothetical protein